MKNLGPRLSRLEKLLTDQAPHALFVIVKHGEPARNAVKRTIRETGVNPADVSYMLTIDTNYRDIGQQIAELEKELLDH